jgi:tRNA (cmo5U34)-methyltransferase
MNYNNENTIECKERINTIKEDFAKRSTFYDDYIVKVVPNHGEMLDALVNSMPFPPDKPIRIVELGCGTGMATGNIIRKFPNAHLKCIDISQDMLNVAKKKFTAFPNIEFELADYTEYNIAGKYDAVVSFLSFMYLANDETRKALFKKVYDVLVPEGFFVSGEVNVSRNKHYQEVCMEKWMEHMRKSYSDEFIKTEVLEKAKKHANESVLTDEIQYLKDIGFRQIDVFWRYYGYSVYGAIK